MVYIAKWWVNKGVHGNNLWPEIIKLVICEGVSMNVIGNEWNIHYVNS